MSDRKLTDLCVVSNGDTPPEEDGDVPVYGANGIIDSTDKTNFDGGIIVGRVGSAAESHYVDQSVWVSDNALTLSNKSGEYNEKYLYYFLSSRKEELLSYAGIGVQPIINQKHLSWLEPPQTSLEEQERIVSLLSDVDEYIEKSSKRVERLQDQKQAIYQRVFEDHTNTEKNPTLDDYGISFIKGKTPSDNPGEIPYLSTGVYRNNDDPEDYTTEDSSTVVKDEDIVMIMDGSNSGEVFSGKSGAISSTMAKLQFEEKIHKPYVKALLEWFYPHINENAMGSTIPHTSKNVVGRIPIFHTREPKQRELADIISKITHQRELAKKEVESMRELKQGLLQEIFAE